MTREPLGNDPGGSPVYLRDIWPTSQEVQDAVLSAVKRELFEETYASVFAGDDVWASLPVPQGALYEWEEASTYVQEPPYFDDLAGDAAPLRDIREARVLLMLGDSITTDHISPAGSIDTDSPAGRYLVDHGVQPVDFNSYGARRGNHQVMVRGTFGNIRLRNQLTPNREGDWSKYLPTGEEMRVYDASERYIEAGIPLVVLAGKEYGSGSSRDWAAKGPNLLGIKATIAESYERIHRSNLVGMGVLPLQFEPGASAKTLGLDGTETFSIVGVSDALRPRQTVEVTAKRDDGTTITFTAIVRVDSPIEVDYLRHGGILPYVLRNLIESTPAGA